MSRERNHPSQPSFFCDKQANLDCKIKHFVQLETFCNCWQIKKSIICTGLVVTPILYQEFPPSSIQIQKLYCKNEFWLQGARHPGTDST